MKNFKRGLYFVTGLAYANSLYERVRRMPVVKELLKSESENDAMAAAVGSCFAFVFFWLFWPIMLVIDLTTKWDS